MKRIAIAIALSACLLLGLCLLPAGDEPVYAQQTNVSLTISQKVINAVSTSGASAIVRDIGQSAHWLKWCTTGSLTNANIQLEESEDGSTNWTPITQVGNMTSGGSCQILEGAGYFANVRANLTALSNCTGCTVSAWYSASASPVNGIVFQGTRPVNATIQGTGVTGGSTHFIGMQDAWPPYYSLLVGGPVPDGGSPSQYALRVAGIDGSGNLRTFQTVNAAGLAAATNVGALTAEKGPRWTVTSNPAAGSQATASKAAGGAAVVHVADCITFSAGAVVAPVLTALTINLRDGATGAGTVKWTYEVIIPAGTGQAVVPQHICGLNIPGTANTAMTMEFSASLANLIESVSLSGYDVN